MEKIEALVDLSSNETDPDMKLVLREAVMLDVEAGEFRASCEALVEFLGFNAP